jgi:hypothetical protein
MADKSLVSSGLWMRDAQDQPIGLFHPLTAEPKSEDDVKIELRTYFKTTKFKNKPAPFDHIPECKDSVAHMWLSRTGLSMLL